MYEHRSKTIIGKGIRMNMKKLLLVALVASSVAGTASASLLAMLLPEIDANKEQIAAGAIAGAILAPVIDILLNNKEFITEDGDVIESKTILEWIATNPNRVIAGILGGAFAGGALGYVVSKAIQRVKS